MPVDQEVLDRLFRNARTYRSWLSKPVDPALLGELYDLVKLAPTAFNSTPGRFIFLVTEKAKERLVLTLIPQNVEKTRTAPVTVILAYDTRFHEHLSQLYPQAPKLKKTFGNDSEARENSARLNATLEAGYLIMAARVLGLDCGPIGGFDNEKVDTEFFHNGCWKSLILVNLGYGDPASLYPRNPRLDFSQACLIL